MDGRGLRRPVCSRKCLRCSISDFSHVNVNFAALMSCTMLTALPLILVMQTTGFCSCGTQRAAPLSDSSESLITQISRAARFSAPESCSRVRLSYRDLASVIADMFNWVSSVFDKIDVTRKSRLRSCRFLKSYVRLLASPSHDATHSQRARASDMALDSTSNVDEPALAIL